MEKYFKYIKQLFNNTSLINTSNKGDSTPELKECPVLKLSEQQQENQLISDGYASMITLSSHTIPAKDIGKVDPDLKHLNIPLKATTEAKFLLNFESKFRFNKNYSPELFEFFEGRLNDFINVQMFEEHKLFSDHLVGSPEQNKWSAAYGYFKGIFNSFNYELLQDSEPIDTLPSGVEPTNFLSKLWMYETYLKESMFRDDRELIVRYLYCKESLMVDNIHAYHKLLREIITICARRNLMIEINDRYDFEKNHPYSLKYSRGLIYSQHSELFDDEIGFEWMIQKLSAAEELKPVFLNRLTKVLRTENVFNLKTKNTQFCTFLNSNFNTDLKKLRPDEALKFEEGRKEIETLKNELNKFRKSKI